MRVRPTPKQLYVLRNIADVKPRTPQYPMSSRQTRTRNFDYCLDGSRCTQQVTSLILQDLISRDPTNGLSCTEKGLLYQS